MADDLSELVRTGKVATPQDHYDNLLGDVYDWMAGDDFDASVNGQQAILTQLIPSDTKRGAAADLGCGSGFQSFAIAGLGFGSVIGIDTSLTLINKFNLHKTRLAVPNITCHHADLFDLPSLIERNSLDLIVCMGDTLTHLSDQEKVCSLFGIAYAHLAPGGCLITTYRDYTQPLAGADRFIPVRSEQNRIMTCFLEYQLEHVIVHDILHDFREGNWVQNVSAYPKLRLSPKWVGEALGEAGFESLETKKAGRMVASIGRKKG